MLGFRNQRLGAGGSSAIRCGICGDVPGRKTVTAEGVRHAEMDVNNYAVRLPSGR